MELQPLSLNNKDIINSYLSQRAHVLCAYAFENIYVWRCLYDICLSFYKKKLCLFFTDPSGCFMVLPPLGGWDSDVIEACFDQMEAVNHNPDISRIENLEEADLAFFQNKNFRIFEKSKDYLVDRASIASFASGKYKAKRALYNYFIKHYSYCFRDYRASDYKEVVALYDAWAKSRAEKNRDGVYNMLLNDGAKVLAQMLADMEVLPICAKVLEIEGHIRGFTSGFSVTKSIFCVNFEFVDAAFKGSSQYIFSAFASQLKEYEFINMMDDCGIKNIRWTKKSFHPSRSMASYTVLKSG
ncbi:MAG: phosphatidylglycerol lysyltransferase domain-containing protein [Candidatus Omnitrophota bacterium]